MASKLSALKNCWISSYAWTYKTKDALLETKDSLLKTEDVLLKTKDDPGVKKKIANTS